MDSRDSKENGLSQPLAANASEHGVAFETRTNRLLDSGQLFCNWRASGEKTWREWHAHYPKAIQKKMTVSMDPFSVEINLHQVQSNIWQFSGLLQNVSASPVELSRFHYFHGNVTESDLEFLSMSEMGLSSRRYNRSDAIAPNRNRVESVWKSMNVDWPRLSDPLHGESNWGTSVDVGLLLRGWSGHGLLAGFTGPGSAFGEIGYGTCRASTVPFYIGLLLDGIVLGPGETRQLERCILIWDDWQDAIKAWAKRCALEAESISARSPMVGYCSWYQHYHKIEAAHILRAADELAEMPIPPGGRALQIDDGFQRMPGDWRPNERFAQVFEGLPASISETGSIPGLWLAPTAIFHSHPILEEHPDWIQRLADGQPAVAFSNWGWCDSPDYKWGDIDSPTYFLEPDHPGARGFIRRIVEDAVAQGWRYLKIDFAYALSTARLPYDRQKTSMETLRDLFALIREAAGPSVKICACIGAMGRYALGSSDIARLGGDVGDRFDTVRTNLSDLLLRNYTNGSWWQADPDVFYLRRESSNLSREESWLLTGTIWLMGGIAVTSDFPSQWDDSAHGLLKRFWNGSGPETPVDARLVYDAGGLVAAYRVTLPSVNCKIEHRVAIYNWTESPQTTNVRVRDLGIADALTVLETIPHAQSIVHAGDMLLCRDQPAHSLRIARVICG